MCVCGRTQAHARTHTSHYPRSAKNQRQKETTEAASGGGKRYDLRRNDNPLSGKIKCNVGKASSGCFAGYERRLGGKRHMWIRIKAARYLQAMRSAACWVLEMLWHVATFRNQCVITSFCTCQRSRFRSCGAKTQSQNCLTQRLCSRIVCFVARSKEKETRTWAKWCKVWKKKVNRVTCKDQGQ